MISETTTNHGLRLDSSVQVTGSSEQKCRIVCYRPDDAAVFLTDGVLGVVPEIVGTAATERAERLGLAEGLLETVLTVPKLPGIEPFR